MSIKKLLEICATEASKKIGSNYGNTFFNCAPHKHEPNKALQNVVAVESMKFVTTKQDWDAIDENAISISQYVELLAPVAATTAAAYLVIPVVAGASSFALLGAGASTVAYGISNIGVLIGGAYASGKRITANIKLRNHKKNEAVQPIIQSDNDQTDHETDLC